MTYLPKPKLAHPELQKNDLGFTRRDYEGSISTLCAVPAASSSLHLAAKAVEKAEEAAREADRCSTLSSLMPA